MRRWKSIPTTRWARPSPTKRRSIRKRCCSSARWATLLDDWLAGSSPERQRRILERRYGLNGADVMTLEALASELGLTRERVRQIQVEALDRLRTIIKRGGVSRDSLL